MAIEGDRRGEANLENNKDLDLVASVLNTENLLCSEKAESNVRREAIEQLSSILGSDRINNEVEQVNQLCEVLEDFQLAIDIAGRYIKNHPENSFQVYLEEIQEKIDIYQLPSVQAAFMMSWEKLDIETKILGVLLGGFPATSLPWELVQATKEAQVEDTPEYGGEYDYTELTKQIDKLVLYGFVKLETDTQKIILNSVEKSFLDYVCRTQS